MCPDDVNKSLPGICGCGIADIDSDGDHAYDCEESCPSDPEKQSPGVCGCGVPDTDGNVNGTADCMDLAFQSDVLEAMADELADAELGLAQGGTIASRDETRDLLDGVQDQMDRVLDLIPSDDDLVPGTDLATSTTALGRAWAAGTTMRSGPIGLKTDGTPCADNALFDRAQLNASPFTAFFASSPYLRDVPSMMRSVHALSRLKAGLRCLRTPELAVLDRAAASMLLDLVARLGASGRSAAAAAFFDSSLPIQLLIFDAVKAFNTPFTWGTHA